MENFTSSELITIKECVKSHPLGYMIMVADDKYNIMKECLMGQPNTQSIIDKIDSLVHPNA